MKRIKVWVEIRGETRPGIAERVIEIEEGDDPDMCAQEFADDHIGYGWESDEAAQ